MKYCSLDEAWGTNFEDKDGCDVYLQHKKKFEEDRPSNTPNSNSKYKEGLPTSNLNVRGYSPESKYYERDTLQDFQKNQNQNQNQNQNKNQNQNQNHQNKEFEKKTFDEKDEDVFSFINTLSLDNYTKKILINKINKLVGNMTFEPQTEVKEHFSPYYIQNDSKSIDLLFLILLGLFLIFILDKK